MRADRSQEVDFLHVLVALSIIVTDVHDCSRSQTNLHLAVGLLPQDSTLCTHGLKNHHHSSCAKPVLGLSIEEHFPYVRATALVQRPVFAPVPARSLESVLSSDHHRLGGGKRGFFRCVRRGLGDESMIR